MATCIQVCRLETPLEARLSDVGNLCACAGSGAISAPLRYMVKQKPLIIGKPNKPMLDTILERQARLSDLAHVVTLVDRRTRQTPSGSEADAHGR
jgi:hypothetical protein